MTTKLENDDTYFEIQLLSYDNPTSQEERYYFLEMSTLQATTLIGASHKIALLKLEVHINNINVDEKIIATFTTVGDFNSFFIDLEDYDIHNCDLEIETGIKLSSHDDGEVSIQFSKDNTDGNSLIKHLFIKYKIDKKIVDLLKSRPGHYLAIDKKGNVIADFLDFDEYLKKGR